MAEVAVLYLKVPNTWDQGRWMFVRFSYEHDMSSSRLVFDVSEVVVEFFEVVVDGFRSFHVSAMCQSIPALPMPPPHG